MEEMQDVEVDPELASMMGFSGFGMQPGKKRKFDKNDGVVGPSAEDSANVFGKGESVEKEVILPSSGGDVEVDANPDKTTMACNGVEIDPVRDGTSQEASHVGDPATSVLANNSNRLRALRRGILDEHGDMAYFLPSFIEDPWEGLEPN